MRTLESFRGPGCPFRAPNASAIRVRAQGLRRNLNQRLEQGQRCVDLPTLPCRPRSNRSVGVGFDSGATGRRNAGDAQLGHMAAGHNVPGMSFSTGALLPAGPPLLPAAGLSLPPAGPPLRPVAALALPPAGPPLRRVAALALPPAAPPLPLAAALFRSLAGRLRAPYAHHRSPEYLHLRATIGIARSVARCGIQPAAAARITSNPGLWLKR